jgi:hypothetical protein
MKKALAVSAVLATVAVMGWTASVVLAQTLHNPQEAANCGTQSGVWHFVHNQTSATSGTITVNFSGAGDGMFANTPSNSRNLHYHVTGSGTLLSAIDSVNGGKLVLSDCPEITTTTETTTETTTDETTTTD